jgi:hypothetical protein
LMSVREVMRGSRWSQFVSASLGDLMLGFLTARCGVSIRDRTYVLVSWA